MSTSRNVAVVVGSLRKESFNRKMANALIAFPLPGLRRPQSEFPAARRNPRTMASKGQS